MKPIFYCLALASLVVALAAPVAEAAGTDVIREASVYPFFQYFKWEEFSRDGAKLLKETGPQFGVGGNIKLDLLKGNAGAMTVAAKQELFGGVVDYDGQLQDGTPHKTDVNYFGSYTELDLGWAIPYRKMTIEPFSGLSYRWWLRDLQGSGGYTENWYSLALLLGLRSQYELGTEARFFVAGAAKYPFSNRNAIDNYPGVGEINLSPGSEWSALAESGIKYKQFTATVYYENFIFPASDPVTRYNAFRTPTPGPSSFVQPRSESEIFGLRFGWAFK
ncbi:hypothetical protein KI809_04250 [Geobacter pelophilus]|uniref:Outer membrane protein beta-barrel domain-containing protein n=1 Tax=Geoanaerobacter pelophilus TaxID=60036 RepID=A0AAW4L1U8_9BACT|nr:hypothetical protein [Geoanaerobacter pelophilus]MBT0663507.1 hypothetical protein [Geoanaerobacter pelophilus]